MLRMLRTFSVLSLIAVTLLCGGVSPANAACTAPDATTGDIIYNADAKAFQGCTRRGWLAFHKTDAPIPGPTNCPNAGDICDDGTIYAGLSPDGDVPMYAMPTDGPAGGHEVAPIGGYTWDDGTSNWVDLAMGNCDSPSSVVPSCNTGRDNTTFLAALNGGSPAPYPAAQHCENLVANGYSDWYLPAQNELKILYALYVAGKGGFVADYYWSSTERSSNNGWSQYFSNGAQFNSRKYFNYRVRCVRR